MREFVDLDFGLVPVDFEQETLTLLNKQNALQRQHVEEFERLVQENAENFPLLNNFTDCDLLPVNRNAN